MEETTSRKAIQSDHMGLDSSVTYPSISTTASKPSPFIHLIHQSPIICTNLAALFTRSITVLLLLTLLPRTNALDIDDG